MQRLKQRLGQAYRTLATILTLVIYFGFGPFGYAFFGLMLLWPAKDPFKRARRLQAVQSFAFRFMHRWLTVAQVLRTRWTNLDLDALPKGAFVVVANHHTISDASAIMGAFRGLSTIVRPGIFSAWWIGGLVRGSLHIKGTNTYAGAGRVVADGLHRLSGGLRVVFFPEGTRSPLGELHRFSRVPFEVACQADKPVVTIRVLAGPGWLTKTAPALPSPLEHPHLNLTVMDIFHPADYGHDSKRLAQAVRERYERSFAERPGKPPFQR